MYFPPQGFNQHPSIKNCVVNCFTFCVARKCHSGFFSSESQFPEGACSQIKPPTYSIYCTVMHTVGLDFAAHVLPTVYLYIYPSKAFISTSIDLILNTCVTRICIYIYKFVVCPGKKLYKDGEERGRSKEIT